MADEFNEYFAQVGYNLAKEIDSSGPPAVDDSAHALGSVFTLHTITEHDLLKYVTSLRGNSAPGVDGIKASFLKEHFHILSKPLLHIVNESIRSGEFPDVFKVAKVIPLYKSNDVTCTSNFRPISLLSVFAKVIEKIVKDQLTKYLEDNDILTDTQFGFRKSKNISDALFYLNKDINSAISKNNRSLVVFLDLAKAFDSVDRENLLNKLELIGVRGKSHDWFKSYFENRRQQVSINGICSGGKSVDYGVIQGSTLGPLLFLIYINNLSKINISGKLYLFADDTAIFFENKEWKKLFDNASKDLAVVKKWFDNNTLTLNVSKTKFLPISLRDRGDILYDNIRIHTCGNTSSLTCGCNIIEQVSSYKYLGVVFDSKLSWNKHIEYVNKRLRKMIYAFRQLNQVLNIHELKMAYCAYIQSILEAGIIAYGGAYKSILKPLEITQKAIIKAALGVGRRYPTEDVFSNFKVFDIRQLYVRNIMLFTCKKRGEFLENPVHEYNTRCALNIGVHAPKILRSFSVTNSFVIAHYIYRNIPDELRKWNSYSIQQYKTLVNRWIVETGRDNIELIIASNYTT